MEQNQNQKYQWLTPAVLCSRKYSQTDIEIAIDQVKELLREARVTEEEASTLEYSAKFVENQGDLVFEVKIIGPRDTLFKVYRVVEDEDDQYPPYMLRSKD